jgi:hypothetical protein
MSRFGRGAAPASLLCVLIFPLLFPLPARAQSMPAPRDTRPDTWVATDALGRAVVTAGKAPPPRANRFVGVFYFLWLRAEEKQGPFDITRILHNHPDAMQHPTSPPWGPLYAPHHWGEPLLGYYLNDDAWVIRKHAQMLADAGVDVIIFDTSNKLTYPRNYLALCKVFEQMRREGNRTPDIAFLTPFWDPRSTVRKLYDEFYSKNLYPDLWFRWEGKPLILADPAKVDQELVQFFTFRKPQPDYFQGSTGPDEWSWLEVYPQHMFKNSRGENEQMSVGVAQNAVNGRLGSMSEPGSHGRSYHNGSAATQPGSVNDGYNFAEQFEHALKTDPKFIFVTGWNEWIAGRFDTFNHIHQPPMFVDEFDEEHSRDIEPMKGGHGDDYYYQLVSFIRRFKGAHPAPRAGPPRTIDLSGSFDQWSSVTPEYLDDVDDTAHRDHPGYATATHYIDKTGRNDIVRCKVAYDPANIYFYVQTQKPITPHPGEADPSWMNLWLNTDRNANTGWHGYDFVVNRRLTDSSHTQLQATRSGWNWQRIGDVPLRLDGNQLMLSIPRKLIGLDKPDQPLNFEFKWSDHCQPGDEINAFTLSGDAAPNFRFNYLFHQ